MSYGTDELYANTLLNADKWHKMAIYWYEKRFDECLANTKANNTIAHLRGLAIFEGLVILGLLIVIIYLYV